MFQVQSSKLKVGAAAFSLLAMLLLLSGCNAVAYVATVVGGGTKIPALYELKDRPTLVFVDDPARKLTTSLLAGQIASGVGHELEDHEVLTKGHVVDPAVVNQMRADHSDFGGWAIDKIGRQAGAEQVIYVSVQDWKLTAEAGNIYEPTSEVRVKVVDVASGMRLYPDPSAEHGYPVVTQRHHTAMVHADASTPVVLARDLADHVAVDVAKMFYKHETPVRPPGEDD